MILPKDFFDKIEYTEYTHESDGYKMYDVFTIHFKAWWRKDKVIRIQRTYEGKDGDNYTYRMTETSHELYNQLIGWARSTFDE